MEEAYSASFPCWNNNEELTRHFPRTQLQWTQESYVTWELQRWLKKIQKKNWLFIPAQSRSGKATNGYQFLTPFPVFWESPLEGDRRCNRKEEGMSKPTEHFGVICSFTNLDFYGTQNAPHYPWLKEPGTKEPLDEGDREEWKSWLKTQH